VPRSAAPFPRYLVPRLREALRDTPAVLIHGPRQSGKTTLARAVGEPRGYRYVSFDDEAMRTAAKSDPLGFAYCASGGNGCSAGMSVSPRNPLPTAPSILIFK